MLKIHYPHKISNDSLYKKVNMIRWSQVIQKRRIKWTGHLLRMNENSPAVLALQQTKFTLGKKLKGNHYTWIKQINKDLQLIDQSYNIRDWAIQSLVEDRTTWYHQ